MKLARRLYALLRARGRRPDASVPLGNRYRRPGWSDTPWRGKP